MPLFDFQTASQVTAGLGTLSRLPQLSRTFGDKAFIVTGRNQARASGVCRLLQESGTATTLYSTAGEPTLDAVREGVQRARDAKSDFLIGFGGGSAIDAAKAIAALMSNSGEPLDYLEIVGRGQQLDHPPLPCIAIPTTAGTGAEVTRNAVLSSPEHQLKASLRGPFLLPRIALVDPELTMGLPPDITANTGLDALTQLLEAFVSRRANTFTHILCREGFMRVRRSLRQAYQAARGIAINDEVQARDDMSFASLLSGMALANAGLGAVHGFASPLGGMLDVPHGAICASLLPAVVRMNIRALRQREPQSPSLQAYSQASEILTGDGRPEMLEEWLVTLCSDLDVKPLQQLGLAANHVSDLVTRAAAASSMRGNPIELTEKELRDILATS